MKSGEYGIYRRKVYGTSGDYVWTEDPALADDSFYYDGRRYEKEIDPAELEDAYRMNNHGIYRGHRVVIAGGNEVTEYIIGVGRWEEAQELGMRQADRGWYDKVVKAEELHVFWEREQMYWDGKSWLPLDTLAMNLEEPRQAVVPMSRWADTDVLSYLESAMEGYSVEQMCQVIEGVEQIYRERGRVLDRQDIPALEGPLGLHKKRRKERIIKEISVVYAADSVVRKLFQDTRPEVWKGSEMRKVIEDYFQRGVGKDYNRKRRKKEFENLNLIPEIREAFDAGIYYADRSRLADLTLHERTVGYPLPRELAEYINCCWHGYICGILPGYPGRMTLFPVYQTVEGTCDDVLFKEQDDIQMVYDMISSISGMEGQWEKHGGLPYYIPIGVHGSLYKGWPKKEQRLILYANMTGEVYLESAQDGVAEEKPAALSLKEFIRRLSFLPGYRTEEELQKDIHKISMEDILQNYYERNGCDPMPGYDRDKPDDTQVSWERFIKDMRRRSRPEAEGVIAQYEEEFGRPLPEEVADYVRSCWYTDSAGAYVGYYRGQGRCFWLCAPAPGDWYLKDTPDGLQGILYLTGKMKESGGDTDRYVAIGRSQDIEMDGYLVYDREDGRIYYTDLKSIEGGKEQLIASSLKDFILHLEY